jgi:hypothetical protein
MRSQNADNTITGRIIIISYKNSYFKTINGAKENFTSDITIIEKEFNTNKYDINLMLKNILQFSYSMLFKEIKKSLEKNHFENNMYRSPKILYIKLHLDKVYIFKSDNLNFDSEPV